eukprot:TRINITY_DN58117_c0_g1_i1.p1 TRINITY_DN58117_c0_g1~~TRINITY_DN58117_c0_g1_i1.p1  ORF type:complete len:403 (-),score=65.61 TRINITY_DN58117_c0_g1_i1:192-1400(-)
MFFRRSMTDTARDAVSEGDIDSVEKRPPSIQAPPPAPASSLPLWQSSLLAVTYCCTCILQFILIRWTKINAVVYDDTSAVMLTEVAKLLTCAVIFYARSGSFLFSRMLEPHNVSRGMWYAVPSLIYAVYNNLTFYNLTSIDAATYQVFMQVRVLFTGLLFTFLLSKSLTGRQWFALCLLAVGVAWKHMGNVEVHSLTAVAFVFFQAALSSFAGVYNEKLLKGDRTMDVFEANAYMYTFAILFNVLFGLFRNPAFYITPSRWVSTTHPLFITIVVNGAVIGIVTSLILRYINVIVKAFASAAEVLLTAFVSHAVFATALTMSDVNACSIVSAAIFLYYYTPGMFTGSWASLREWRNPLLPLSPLSPRRDVPNPLDALARHSPGESERVRDGASSCGSRDAEAV